MPQKRKEDFDDTEQPNMAKKSRKNELSDICQSIYDSLRSYETSSSDVNRLLCEAFIKLPLKKSVAIEDPVKWTITIKFVFFKNQRRLLQQREAADRLDQDRKQTEIRRIRNIRPV
jgi:hypothetical protein